MILLSLQFSAEPEEPENTNKLSLALKSQFLRGGLAAGREADVCRLFQHPTVLFRGDHMARLSVPK